MTNDWTPTTATKRLDVQAGFDDERIRFRFRWAQPNPGGWIHDMLVYHGGEWQQFADPSPWVGDGSEHTGFYEDRISFFLDDGSVRGFEEFGGWLTTHDGMRSLPSEASTEAVRSHSHYGSRGSTAPTSGSTCPMPVRASGGRATGGRSVRPRSSRR